MLRQQKNNGRPGKASLLRLGLVILAITFLLAALLYDSQRYWSLALVTVGALTFLASWLWYATPVGESKWPSILVSRLPSRVRQRQERSGLSNVEKWFNLFVAVTVIVIGIGVIGLLVLFRAITSVQWKTISIVRLDIIIIIGVATVLLFIAIGFARRRRVISTFVYLALLSLTVLPLWRGGHFMLPGTLAERLQYPTIHINPEWATRIPSIFVMLLVVLFVVRIVSISRTIGDALVHPRLHETLLAAWFFHLLMLLYHVFSGLGLSWFSAISAAFLVTLFSSVLAAWLFDTDLDFDTELLSTSSEDIIGLLLDALSLSVEAVLNWIRVAGIFLIDIVQHIFSEPVKVLRLVTYRIKSFLHDGIVRWQQFSARINQPAKEKIHDWLNRKTVAKWESRQRSLRDMPDDELLN